MRKGAAALLIVHHPGAATLSPFFFAVLAIFEVLEGPIHGGNELETSNCNYRHNEPCKNIIQHRDICWCNN
jgi:hypothetical protein